MPASPNSLLVLDYATGTGSLQERERKVTEMIRQLQIIRERLLSQVSRFLSHYLQSI